MATVNVLLSNFDKELNDRMTADTKPTKRYFTKVMLVEKAVRQYYNNQLMKQEILEAIERISKPDENYDQEWMEQIKQQVYEISKIRNELVMDQSMMLENRKLKIMNTILYHVAIDRFDKIDLKEIEAKIAFEQLLESGQLQEISGVVSLSERALLEIEDNT